MLTISFFDNMLMKEPGFIKTKNIILDRTGKLNKDIMICTDKCVKYVENNNTKIKIAVLLESPEFYKDQVDYVYNNLDKFDLILTFNKILLDLNLPKIQLNLYGTTWLNADYRKLYDKTKLCSIIASIKRTLFGHRLRHDIIEMNNNNFDCYGGAGPNNKLQFPRKLDEGLRYGTHKDNLKILGLKDYMFSITIENCKVDYYFTEKLIDCFLSGTVPIYWGCPGIGKFFNIKGILMFDTKEECFNLIKTLSEEQYYNMLPYVKENFEEAKKYVNYSLNEEAILNMCSNI